MNTNEYLIKKYNVPCPRYTSYPTVPYWEKEYFTGKAWEAAVQKNFYAQGQEEGISLYLHLPYCESLCTYCGCNTRITVNHAVERPYIDTLLKEWELYLTLLDDKPLIRELHLGGGTPTFFSPEHLTLLINGILQRAAKAEDAEFSFEGHPANTTDEHLQALYDVGFRRVSFGVQDFDPKVQDIIHRIQSYEQVSEVTEQARRIGYTSVNFDLVYGLPLQTKESIRDTIEKVKALDPDRIAFYSYAHVPWLKPGQRRFTEADLPDNEYKRQLYETGKHLLQEAGYLEIGMDHFAKPEDALYLALCNGTLHRNFMGYTPLHSAMLIGLGCSSISDAGTAYAQNKKTVEEYMDAVARGELPVFTGHLKTPEDEVLGQHVLSLICRYETSWAGQLKDFPVLYDTLHRLSAMEEEGLIVINDSTLYVTERGKPFIRNICSQFDVRLQEKQSEKPLFSKSI